MSFQFKGQVCPICKAYLFPEDDIAVCPTCGVPHHRQCFIEAGSCGMEEFHGTDKQYDRQKTENEEESSVNTNYKQEQEAKNDTVQCPKCKNFYPASNSFCHHCGTPNVSSSNPFVIKLDYLGGVKGDEDLGEGHKADEVKNFVAVSTNRIIPKFKQFKKGAKVSFSVWHLLFPAASFAMRKMYAFASLAGALQVAATLLMIPFNLVLGELMNNTNITGYYQLAQYMVENMDKALLSNFLLSAVGILLQVFVRLMSGLFANKLYYKHVLKSMSEIKSAAADDEEKMLLYRKRGGVNIFAFTLFYMVVTWLPSFIYSCI